MVEIDVKSLNKVFDTPSGPETAVKSETLSIEHGEFFTFVGPSGCGKTTFLRMLSGLENPTEGKIYFDGDDVTDLPPQQRNLAMVFQDVTLYPHMTNRDNIGFPLKTRGETQKYEEEIEEVANMLEITETLDKKPGQLSGGQQQRVALARAIVRDPNVILMDEPMSDLDAQLKAQLRVQLQRLHDAIDTTIVYVTHDQHEAMTMSDRIALMNGGQVVDVDTPERIYNNPKNVFCATFMGQPTINIIDDVSLSKDGQLAFWGEEIPIGLGDHSETLRERLSDNMDFRVGVRPQHITLTSNLDESLFELEVDVWEPIDTDYIIYMKREGGNDIKAVTEQAGSLSKGQVIGVSNFERIYIFDGKSEESIIQLDSSDIIRRDQIVSD